MLYFCLIRVGSIYTGVMVTADIILIFPSNAYIVAGILLFRHDLCRVVLKEFMIHNYTQNSTYKHGTYGCIESTLGKRSHKT